MSSNIKNGDAWRRTQTLVCVFLILVMFTASFIPLYSIDVQIPSKMQSAVDDIEDVINDPLISDGEEITIDFPEKLNVNLVLFFKAGTKLGDVMALYRGMLELAEVKNASSINDYHQAYNDLKEIAADMKELVTGDDLPNIIALGATVVSAYSQSTLLGIIMILMLVMTVVLPISLFITLFITLVGLTVHAKDAEKRYLWVMKAFRRATRVYLLVLAIGLFDSNVDFSVGIIIGLAACVGGFAFSAFACRRKKYSVTGRLYLNLIQLISSIETVLFFALYFSIAKSGVIGQYASLIGKRAIPYIRSKEYGKEFLSQFLFILLAFVGIAALVVFLALLPNVLSKLGGMLPRNQDSNIFAVCCTLALVVALTLAAVTEKTIVVSQLGTALIVLSYAFALLLIICEVTLKLLRPEYCSALKETERYAILTGLDVVETEAYNEEDN